MEQDARGRWLLSIAGRVAEYFDAVRIPYDVEDGGRILRLSFIDGDSELSWMCLAYSYDEDDLLVFFSVSPENVPADRRAVAAEYLTRANYGLPLGNFEMDWADGEVRCRTSVHIAEAPLLTGVIRSVVTTNLGLMMRYLPGLLLVAAGQSEPAAAIAAAEATSVEPPAL